ncbi:unnamed protein product [Closterium sp. NIES-65]|nr:unnamed protein product [Closterium sp. NIES-65]
MTDDARNPPTPLLASRPSLRPRHSHLRPRRSHLRPRRSHLRPRRSHLRPRRSHRRPRRSHLRPSRFHFRPRRPDLRPRPLLQRRPPPELPEPPHPAEQPTAAPPCITTPEPPGQPSGRTAEPPSCPAAEQPSRPAPEPPSSRATGPPSRTATEPPSLPVAEPPSRPTAEPPELPRPVMATPSVLAFDAEGRAIDFDVWVDDLQLFLQSDRADGLSLFDLNSGASPAPAADADANVRSQWATRDAAARLAVRRHLPTSERAHFSQYKSAQTLDHFLAVCPTTLTVDLLEKALLAAEKSIVAVGASCGDPRTPVFEGCSPSPLLPSVASAAAADLVAASVLRLPLQTQHRPTQNPSCVQHTVG